MQKIGGTDFMFHGDQQVLTDPERTAIAISETGCGFVNLSL